MNLRSYRPSERRGNLRLEDAAEIEGFLNADLEAPDDWTEPLEHVDILDVIEWDSETDTFYETGETATIHNIDTTLTAGTDYYVRCRRVNGQWRVSWASCEAVR